MLFFNSVHSSKMGDFAAQGRFTLNSLRCWCCLSDLDTNGPCRYGNSFNLSDRCERIRVSGPAIRVAPSFLRHLFLSFVAGLSVFLAVLCIIMAAKSRQNDGLLYVPASSSFVCNFLPTLVAVLYGLLWASICQDVIQTEAWALLSRPGGAKASESILMENEFTWNHILQAQNND
jgi:hypothetical protein